jgi:hypothetical protein
VATIKSAVAADAELVAVVDAASLYPTGAAAEGLGAGGAGGAGGRSGLGPPAAAALRTGSDERFCYVCGGTGHTGGDSECPKAAVLAMQPPGMGMGMGSPFGAPKPVTSPCSLVTSPYPLLFPVFRTAVTAEPVTSVAHASRSSSSTFRFAFGVGVVQPMTAPLSQSLTPSLS